MVLVLYSVWLVIPDVQTKIGFLIHVVNFVIWCLLYNIFGLHKDRLRFSSLKSYIPILKLSIILALILWVESIFLFSDSSIFAAVLFGLAALNCMVGMRILARHIIRQNAQKNRDNILVYGLSDVAIDLVNAMAFGKKYNVVGYIADLPLKKSTLSGLPVIQLADVQRYSEQKNCKLIVLANEREQSYGSKEILQKFDKLGLSVSYAPTMDRAFDYEVQLKAVKPEDVLGRPSTIKFDETIYSNIRDRTILVTGAGGSIGSELCRQILRYQPKKLVILEINEYALYTLEHELSDLQRKQNLSSGIVYVLGSITDEAILKSIFDDYTINTVYHAAAYKHVPIVENNVTAGIVNNVFGTKLLADFANHYDVKKFVLVSTDKAVRPSNIMGASKRIAELIIQDFAKTSKTIFTMVRFGNVLGSSGSVIPKFKSQINAGGPVTVTHEDITRYFMSIPEAAHLILNAETFAKGGEVFLLDMGNPVKIIELAKSMIRQHGLQPVLADDLETRAKQHNEITIEFSGLRPGEKLYEELLVDGVSEQTPNPKIFKSIDSDIEKTKLNYALSELDKFARENNSTAIRGLLESLPIAYGASSKSTLLNEIHEEKRKHAVKQNAQKTIRRSPKNEKQPTSLLQKFVTSNVGLLILHRFFLISRGMTLGVRVLVQNDLDEILLVKHTYMEGWHLPGGGVNHGESIHSAARREVYEECGLKNLHNLDLVKFEYNSKVSYRDHVAYFTAHTSQNPSICGNFEIQKVAFFALENLPRDFDASVLEGLRD